MFWQKIRKTLRTTKIIVQGKKRHKTYNTIEHPDFFHRKITSYKDFDDITKWANKESKKIEPESFVYKFLCEGFLRGKHIFLEAISTRGDIRKDESIRESDDTLLHGIDKPIIMSCQDNRLSFFIEF
jgi:hypothetical protein